MPFVLICTFLLFPNVYCVRHGLLPQGNYPFFTHSLNSILNYLTTISLHPLETEEPFHLNQQIFLISFFWCLQHLFLTILIYFSLYFSLHLIGNSSYLHFRLYHLGTHGNIHSTNSLLLLYFSVAPRLPGEL